MKKVLFFLLFVYCAQAVSLEIAGVKNAQLQDLYLYNGSRLEVVPEDGVIVSVKGKANKRVKLEIKANGAVYLTPGVRIEDLRAKYPVINLDKYGEGEFQIGFSLRGEKKVSGKLKKQIRYRIEYVDYVEAE